VRFLLTNTLLLCGLAAGVRLCWAELAFRDDSPSQVEAALRHLGSTPNASYVERLADLIPNGQAQLLSRALEANQRLTSARIALGLLEERIGDFGERTGDFSSAEQTLLQAARYDRQYLPAWTLANFYFRRDQADSFWHWARRAAQLSGDNPRPLLRLASLEERDPAVVLDRLQGGDNAAYYYLDMLIAAGRLDAANALVPVLVRSKAVHKDQLLDLTTRQLQAGNISWALKTWNALCKISTGCAPLDPEHGPLLPAKPETTDGQGFHPTLVSNPGITAAASPEEVKFSFDGSQPDPCPLFEQPVPAPRRAAKRFRLQFEYKSSATGARWTMAGSESPILSFGQDWQHADWTVSARPDSGADDLRVLKLRLIYHREPGTIPAQGELHVRNLQVTIL
jgi:hypothetical protein